MTHDLFNTPPAIVAIDKLDKQGLTADTHKVALAAALLWTYCTRTDLYHLLPLLAFKDSAGRIFTVERIDNQPAAAAAPAASEAAAAPTPEAAPAASASAPAA